ncbi:helix-turn-helix domain-containing protein [Marilutibacter alkalisoli]|uniref:helix-turn-helix domain-containing protein n=1 Tax=Marilutibacter alkalisoli TaxID=2591633 RepID=UPI003134643D
MIQPDPIKAGSERSCGQRLKKARLKAGLSREDVAHRLKMPARVVEALETDHWEVLGAPVFVRGQLKSYARLLKLDMDVDGCLDEANLPPVAPPELISHSHVPHYRRVLEQATRNAVYIVMTAAIALPVWWATRDHLRPSSSPTVQSLEVPEGLSPVLGSESNDGESGTGASAMVPRRSQRTPVVASMTRAAPNRHRGRPPACRYRSTTKAGSRSSIRRASRLRRA